MQPLQYDLRSPAAKDNSITYAAKAGSNLDTSHLHCGNAPTVAKHNGIPLATHPPATLAIPFTLRERSYSCKSQWNSVLTTHARKTVETPFTMRNRSEHDPRPIRG